MSDVRAEPVTSNDEEAPQVVRSTARVRRARKRRRRATAVFSGVTVLFVVAAVLLSLVGWRSTLRITGGRDLEVTDPSAPGYSAEVKPTSAELIAITSLDGSLLTMLLALAGASDGEVTFVPISAGLTIWDYEDAGPMVADDLYASGGLDVLALRLGVDLTFGLTSAGAVPASELEGLFNSLGPTEVELPDTVFTLGENGEREVKYQAGKLTLEPSQMAEFLGFRGRDEPELSRSLRLQSLWTALLGELSTTRAGLGLSAEVADSVPMLASVHGSASDSTESPAPRPTVEMLPTTDVPLYTDPPIVLDKIDQIAMPSWVSRFVPFPTSAYPGQRAIVNLLNGTTDKDVIKSVASRVVEAGGAVELTGNAPSFDIETSMVEYSSDQSKAAAEAIAAQFGVTPTLAKDSVSGVDVTVVVGKDLVT